MNREKQNFVPLRLKVCTVLSGIILSAVCSMEFIDVSWKNEPWVGYLALALLGGCLLLMWWSFGGFDRKREK